MTVLMIVLAVMWAMMHGFSPAPDTIEYQGQTILLNRRYANFEEYEKDPAKIAPQELERVHQLVKGAPIAREFPDRVRMIDAICMMNFPGYGLITFGDQPQVDGTVLALHAVEIPQSGSSRYLLFRGVSEKYTLIDDFVHEDADEIALAVANGPKVLYMTKGAAKVLERYPSIK